MTQGLQSGTVGVIAACKDNADACPIEPANSATIGHSHW